MAICPCSRVSGHAQHIRGRPSTHSHAQKTSPPLLLDSNSYTPLELLVLALVVCMHLMPARSPPHDRVCHAALLVINEHVSAIVAVVIGYVSSIHILLQSAKAEL